MTPKTKDWQDRTEGELRALGLERLRRYRAEPGRYERWLASEGVPVVYGPPEPKPRGNAVGAPLMAMPHPWAPPWVNELAEALHGQRFVDALREALRARGAAAYAGAVSAAYALGGLPAVEALVLSRLGEEDAA